MCRGCDGFPEAPLGVESWSLLGDYQQPAICIEEPNPVRPMTSLNRKIGGSSHDTTLQNRTPYLNISTQLYISDDGAPYKKQNPQ